MIAVIGGAGYIGSHTVKMLDESGIDIVIFDNLSTGHREFVPDHIPFVEGDLGNNLDLQNLFTQYPSIRTVIHFAALAYVGESVQEPAKYYENNVIHTIRLLDAMTQYEVKEFVFSSTCAVYGNPLQPQLTEEHSKNPINPYGRTKWMVEQVLRDYSQAYGLRYAALRYFNAAGASPQAEIGEWHDPETHLIPLVLDVAAGNKEKITIFGDDYNTKDGTCIRDYIHVVDLAQAHQQAVDYIRAGEKNDVFNLGNGSGYSVFDVINTVEQVTGHSVSVNVVGRRDGDPAVLIGSAEKAQRVLGWKPEYGSLTDIISTAWNWHQKMNGGRT